MGNHCCCAYESIDENVYKEHRDHDVVDVVDDVGDNNNSNSNSNSKDDDNSPFSYLNVYERQQLKQQQRNDETQGKIHHVDGDELENENNSDSEEMDGRPDLLLNYITPPLYCSPFTPSNNTYVASNVSPFSSFSL
jgi:hypothetical protein